MAYLFDECEFFADDNQLADNNKTNNYYGKNGGQRVFTKLNFAPTTPNDPYIFRILNFKPIDGFKNKQGCTRTKPFIKQNTHTFYKEIDGKIRLVGNVVCPTTSYDTRSGGKNTCPICKYYKDAWQQMYANGTVGNKNASDKAKVGKTYKHLYIPVCVISNPNNHNDDGTLRVIDIRSQEWADKFGILCSGANIGNNKVFNINGNMDCCIGYGKVTKENPKNHFKYTMHDITNIQFIPTTHNLADKITEETLRGMRYDEQFFEISTDEEIEDYFNKYCLGVDTSKIAKTSTDESSVYYNESKTEPVVSQKVEDKKQDVSDSYIDPNAEVNTDFPFGNNVEQTNTSNGSFVDTKPNVSMKQEEKGIADINDLDSFLDEILI